MAIARDKTVCSKRGFLQSSMSLLYLLMSILDKFCDRQICSFPKLKVHKSLERWSGVEKCCGANTIIPIIGLNSVIHCPSVTNLRSVCLSGGDRKNIIISLWRWWGVNNSEQNHLSWLSSGVINTWELDKYQGQTNEINIGHSGPWGL